LDKGIRSIAGCVNVMALIAQIALGVIIAAAEPTGTLTLACKGTNIVEYVATHTKVSSQVTIGIIVDFQKKTVVGFTPGDDIPVMIKDVDETAISFEGQALNVIISGNHNKRGDHNGLVGATMQANTTNVLGPELPFN
jgi:archaellum component FlaG (FlaF/FlaG flagellin family)